MKKRSFCLKKKLPWNPTGESRLLLAVENSRLVLIHPSRAIEYFQQRGGNM